MSDLVKCVSVKELTEWIENWFVKNRNYHPYAKSNNIPIPELYDILEQMPSARRKGEWVWMGDTGDSRWMCSVCHGKEKVPTIMGKPIVWDYCPNCGAWMKGEEDETD